MSSTATINRGGDLLSLTAQRGGTVLVSLHSVNPAAHLTGLSVPADALRTAVDDVAPFGSYTRHESPDLADGGVTAAAIEKETEDSGGPLDETVDFWRSRWKEAADRADARDLAAHQWKEATRENIARFRAARDFAEMCQKGSRAATVRAEKAERERDEVRDAWEGAVESVKEANSLINSLRAAESRPLTPDAITDEMVERARRRGSEIVGALWDASVVEAMLTAALTEPPARPEGAEKLAEVIDGLLTGDEGIYADDLADSLARCGVRVVTEGGAA